MRTDSPRLFLSLPAFNGEEMGENDRSFAFSY